MDRFSGFFYLPEFFFSNQQADLCAHKHFLKGFFAFVEKEAEKNKSNKCSICLQL